MATNADPDETLVLDLGMFRRALILRLRADRIICEQDVAVIRAFDQPYRDIARRTRVRKAFDSLMRNGDTRTTRENAKDAGITVIVGGKDRTITDVVYIGDDPDRAA